MATSSFIAQQTVRILRYIDNATLPDIPSEDDSTLQALYSVHKLFPGCAVITCPAQHKNFFYISDNCENIFGYTAEYITANFKEFSGYVSQIHEADLDGFRECLSVLEEFVETLYPNEFLNMRVVFHYRFRHAGGQY